MRNEPNPAAERSEVPMHIGEPNLPPHAALPTFLSTFPSLLNQQIVHTEHIRLNSIWIGADNNHLHFISAFLQITLTN